MIHTIINRTQTFVRKNRNICQWSHCFRCNPNQLNFFLIINNIRSGSKCAWGNARKPNEQYVHTLEEYQQVNALQKQREFAYKGGRSRPHCDWGTDSSCERARAASCAGAGGRTCPAERMRQNQRRRRRPCNLQWSERATGEQRTERVRRRMDWEASIQWKLVTCSLETNTWESSEPSPSRD